MALRKAAVAALTSGWPISKVPATCAMLGEALLVCKVHAPCRSAAMTCVAPSRPCMLSGHARTVRSVALLRATLALV